MTNPTDSRLIRIAELMEQFQKKRYTHKGKTYTFVDYIQSKNPSTREWDVHVLYKNEKGDLYSRHVEEFYARFSEIPN